MPARFRDRRVRYEPGSADWLHEREWRLTFNDDETPDFVLTADAVAGVIVGEQGWMPPSNFDEQPLPHELFNYGKDLVADGTFALRERYEYEKWFLLDFMGLI